MSEIKMVAPAASEPTPCNGPSKHVVDVAPLAAPPTPCKDLSRFYIYLLQLHIHPVKSPVACCNLPAAVTPLRAGALVLHYEAIY